MEKFEIHAHSINSTLVDKGPILTQSSAVVGTLFATRVPANLLPAGTQVPIYWIEYLPSFKSITHTHGYCNYLGVPGYPLTALTQSEVGAEGTQKKLFLKACQ